MSQLIEYANAFDWLKGKRAELILTDPPHLIDFDFDAEGHMEFVMKWRTAAEETGAMIVHSCGENALELKNYLSFPMTPNAIYVWQHPNADVHHFYLCYGSPLASFPGVCTIPKPYPWYDWIINVMTTPGDTVLDPFCGQGEIPLAALRTGRYYAGCDINPTSVAVARTELDIAARSL